MSVRVDSGGEGLMTALRSVHAGGVEIDDIAMRQPNLDEVFLALTGHQTDANGTPPPTRPRRERQTISMTTMLS